MPQTALQPLFRLDLPIADDPIRRVLNRRVPWALHGEVFSQQSFGAGPWPDQGWKLHVSATPLSAVEVLEAALDVLFAEGARFKVVGSLSLLVGLNSGELGLSQIGKFITVYPSDDEQAVRMAVALDEVTRGLRGPRVPTDRPLRPDSLVHYRYGAMIRRPESEALGDTVGGAYDLLDSAGRLTDDVRLQYYVPPPEEIVDPFEAAGAYVPRPQRGTLLNGRYLVNNALAQPPRGGVFRAVDLGAQPARLCLLKEAWHDVSFDQHGRDARDWAENEARILSRYAGDPMLPQYYDSFELDSNRYVAIEYIEGTSLDRVLEDKHSLKDGIRPANLVAIGLATADALAHLHEIGLVFRDFKPGNVVQTPGGYRLIDFGIAYQYREDDGPALALGTPPFYPREQYKGEHPSPPDDIFAWGAVMHSLACGEPSWAEMPKGMERMRPFARKPVREFRPDFPEALAAVIDRAVAWERADRYPTMLEARAALAEAADRLVSDQVGAMPATGAREETSSVALAFINPAEALRLAREVGDALVAGAEPRGDALCWGTRTEFSERLAYSPDLYSGAAGIGLFLAELARATGDPRYADAARGGARWLAGPAWGRGRAQHGLHCGEPGVALFFLRLAELLDEPGYIQAAELRMRRLRGAAFSTVDLIYGTTGTILTLLRLHAVTGERAYLDDACAAGDHLAQTAAPAPGGGRGCYWEVASASPGGPVLPYLGLLHGAAGMGLALARLGAATGEERYVAAARAAAEMLLGQAVRSQVGPSNEGEPDLDALTWPRHLGDSAEGLQAHCHGAGGIAQFFLWLDQIDPDPRLRAAAAGAASTVASLRAAESRSGVCHGISGIGNALLDCYQAFREPQWLLFARECGGQLQKFRVPAPPAAGIGGEGEGAEHAEVYAMNGEGAISPDLMLGYAGAGSFLLRLANPDTAPELILG